MERAMQDDYITHRSIHEKIIMQQPPWSYASSITQPSWRWSYQHGKGYTRWLHHTPINTGKDYPASTFLIIRIKHNPTILTLFQLHLISRAQWSLVKMKTALRIMINNLRCDQTSSWSSWLRYLRFGVIENQGLRSTCKVVIQPSVTFVHPSQGIKTKAFDHKITRWSYLCFTFIANTTTAVVHRSSHSFNGVV